MTAASYARLDRAAAPLGAGAMTAATYARSIRAAARIGAVR
jgi:hypothetical protein